MITRAAYAGTQRYATTWTGDNASTWDHLRLAGREWRAIHTPGHTVDHLCLFDPETDTPERLANYVASYGASVTGLTGDPAEIARVYNTHEPALRFDEYFEGLHQLVARGIVSQRGMTPKALLHLALLMSSYPNEIISVKPPDLLMRLLGRLGRFLGYHI